MWRQHSHVVCFSCGFRCGDQAWKLLDKYLGEHAGADSRHHRVVATKFLVHGFPLPTALVDAYKVSACHLSHLLARL